MEVLHKKIQDTGNITYQTIISTITLSVYILHHHQKGSFNNNICLIQNIMRTGDLANKKYKQVCDDLPNPDILTKIATSGEVQLTVVHVSIGNKYLGESITSFAL